MPPDLTPAPWPTLVALRIAQHVVGGADDASVRAQLPVLAELDRAALEALLLADTTWLASTLQGGTVRVAQPLARAIAGGSSADDPLAVRAHGWSDGATLAQFHRLADALTLPQLVLLWFAAHANSRLDDAGTRQNLTSLAGAPVGDWRAMLDEVGEDDAAPVLTAAARGVYEVEIILDPPPRAPEPPAEPGRRIEVGR